MLEVWTWPTPNGHKVHIALEELGLAYKVVPVNIGAGEQFKPEFLAINPNHLIPAVIDPEGPGGKQNRCHTGRPDRGPILNSQARYQVARANDK